MSKEYQCLTENFFSLLDCCRILPQPVTAVNTHHLALLQVPLSVSKLTVNCSSPLGKVTVLTWNVCAMNHRWILATAICFEGRGHFSTELYVK